MALIYDGNFIVGGPANTRVSPNFRLRELTRKNGTVKVHRELVSALQILRDRFGAGISVKSMSPRGELGVGSVGLFAWISAVDIDRLAELVEYFKAQGYFRDVERDSDLLYVNIGDPQSLPPIDVTDALQNAVQVTAGFETSGDPFQQVTGNFDGAGLSFGPSQVNFGTGTLVPLFDKFKQVDEDALMDCFSNEQYYMEWHPSFPPCPESRGRRQSMDRLDTGRLAPSSRRRPARRCRTTTCFRPGIDLALEPRAGHDRAPERRDRSART